VADEGGEKLKIKMLWSLIFTANALETWNQAYLLGVDFGKRKK
jgi:hypothetical protein